MQVDSDDNSESFLFLSFSSLACERTFVTVSKNALFCVNEGVTCCGRARSLLHPGEWTGPKTFPPVPPPVPCAVMGCLRGWRFPWQQAAFCASGVMRSGLLKVAREVVVVGVILGWNSHMSHKSKVNNFQPLLTKCLCALPPPPILLANQH